MDDPKDWTADMVKTRLGRSAGASDVVRRGGRRLIAAIFGIALGVGAASEAISADLPIRKAAPVEGVAVCNVAGMAGFILPGSDTCFKISGYVSGQVQAGNLTKQYVLGFIGPAPGPVVSAEGATVASRDSLGFTTRAQLNLDARQYTAYGVLRGYVEIQANTSNGFENVGSPVLINVAYLQWAGLTVGRAGSFFSYLAAGAGWYDFYSPDRVTGNQPVLFAYTATFGNGFAATISIEDPTGANVNGPFNGGYNNVYDGQLAPDVVGVLRLDQQWGSAQVSAVAHKTSALGVSSDTINVWGYAFLGGVTVNLPQIAPGDRVAAQVVYSHAALGYSGIPNTALSAGDQGLNINGNGTIFQLTDALNYDVGVWSFPTTWTGAAFFEHHFTPQFSLTPEASVAFVRYSDAPTMISTAAASFLGGAVAHWDPVPHLDFELGAMYQYTRQATPAAYVGPPAFRPISSGVAGNLSVTRDF
ncbi:MAG TPA: porin [Roseiarcus sp.]|nr:porin [Roseiarcus sp.]